MNSTRRQLGTGWRGKHFADSHKSELSAVDHAREMLAQCNVSESVDPDKASVLLTQQDEKIADLRQTQKNLDQRILK